MGGIIDQRPISRFWHHRICEVTAVISLIVILLYTSDYAQPGALQPFLQVSILSAAIASVGLLTALTLRFWAPEEHLRELSTTCYLMLIVTLGSIVMLSGELMSPFGALLTSSILFCVIFGIAGHMVALGAIVAIALWRASHGQPITMLGQELFLAAALPYLLSILLWSRPPGREGENDSSYTRLRTHLSQVAGSSDVVINAIADGVIALNAKGNIDLINPAAQQIIGWGMQDAIGLNYKSVLKLVDGKNTAVQDISSPIEKALHENKPFTSDVYSLITSSDKTILVSIMASPIGQTGSGVIVVFRDITSEKAEERQQAEFISTASHEMRTPVASIEGYLGLALNPNTAVIDEKARDFITKAHASAQHLGRLFQDLLDVTRADDGRLANNPQVVDVVPYIYEIATGLKPKAEEKGLRFIYKPVPESDTVPHLNDHLAARRMTPVYYANVDNDHLREIIANLMENAIKYTLKGDVVIDVTGDDTKIIISVADTGLGIPAEDQPHLFQKFYRVDNSDTREIGGTGLGLYLCRRLSETIGGRLWVESVYKKGSTFYLELPRIPHEEATRLIEQASIEAERLASREVAREPVAPAPIPVGESPQPVPVAPAPVAPTNNIPITSIESNPRAYMQPREPSLEIPKRNVP